MSRRILAASIIVLTFTFAARADNLDNVAQAQKVQADKTQRQVGLLISQARALEKFDAIRARDLLREAKAMLEEDISLSELQRRELLNQVNNQLRNTQALANVQAKAANTAPPTKKPMTPVFREPDPRQPTVTPFNPNPKPPATTSSGAFEAIQSKVQSTNTQLAAVDKIRETRSSNSAGVLNSLEASATPIQGVVEYPKYWDAITKLRKPKMDPKESKVLEGLNMLMTVNWKSFRLKDAISELMEKTGMPIIVDENTLKEAMIDYEEDTVTLQLPREVTVRTILRTILRNKGLDYIIREGTVTVLSAQRAREVTVTRAYPIQDLVGANPIFYGPYTPLVVQQNVNQLISQIMAGVEPGYWSQNNGPGSITFDPITMSLVVRANAEMHYMLGGVGLIRR